MPKNIVVCCDGTWNAPDFQVGTNVSKLYNYLEDNSREQVKYYDTGVGTGGPMDKLTGGLAGEGLVDNIFEAYRFICSHYEQDDKLYLFGFSRGAYTARALAGVLHDAGVLQDGFTCLEDHYKYHYHNCFDVQLITETNDDFDLSIVCANCRKLYNSINRVKDIYKLEKKKTYENYKLQKKQHKKAAFVAKQSELNPKILAAFPGAVSVAPCIQMIGVWDTVSALGIPSLADVIKTKGGLWKKILDAASNFVFKSSRRQYAFINDQLTPIVKNAYHALAVDERRDMFKPVLWDNTLCGDNMVIEQQWFIGAHADVGGGYNDHTLSDIPLKWMLATAKDHELIFDTKYDKYIHPNHLGLHHLSHLDFPYKFLPNTVRALPKDRKVHDSVYKRMIAGLQYSPDNVFSY